MQEAKNTPLQLSSEKVSKGTRMKQPQPSAAPKARPTAEPEAEAVPSEKEALQALPLFAEAMKEVNTKKKAKGTLSAVAHIAREVNRQSSLSQTDKLSKEELMQFMTQRTDLTKEQLEQAIVVQFGESVLNCIEEGIEEGELASKVIIALAITLYEQSEIYGTLSDLTGASERLLPLLEQEKLRKRRNPGRKEKREETQEDGKKVLKADLVTSSCPIVIINMTDFTKLVLGLNKQDKARPKDKQRVIAVLNALAKKTVYLLSEDKEQMLSTSIIGKQRGAFDVAVTKDKEGNEVKFIFETYRVIELDSLFTKSILKDFSIIRKDTLKLLSGRQSLMTMKLLHVLLEQYSYHHKGFLYEPYKENLFSRIAVAKRYKSNPGDREADFAEAIDRMIEAHLLKPIKKDKKLSDPKRGGYYENQAADGVHTICHFALNPNYETEGTPLGEAILEPSY